MHARTWLLTGCSSGFGRALAELLLIRGERVIATARNVDTLKGLVEAYCDRALALSLDVTRPEQIESVVACGQQRFGATDVLVNNAGYGQVGTVEDSPIEAARAVLETNLFGAIAMIKAVLPGMRQRRSGQIVNIGSVAGQIGFPALGYYCASKFALSGLTESLAAEVSGLGINVTLAELGPFATNFSRSMSVIAPSPHYNLAALSQTAGNSGWGVGDDPRAGAAALLDALTAAAPPRRLILGQPGLDVVVRHEVLRRDERERWQNTSKLEVAAEALATVTQN